MSQLACQLETMYGKTSLFRHISRCLWGQRGFTFASGPLHWVSLIPRMFANTGLVNSLSLIYKFIAGSEFDEK